ncbi:HVA22-LIKE PROTEIN [Salix purpurea]|uniref:HVA22-LIKE PROTEIN n=1 Tax=Salix purpurea TaxID=77065 RepID=A0A9Q0W5B6_SALPP|nr:HVA22-LIKE PROTEIN [Salix purpurea]
MALNAPQLIYCLLPIWDGAKSSSTRLRQNLMLTPFLSVSVYSVVSLSFPVTKKTGSARSAIWVVFWTFLTHAHTLSGPVVMLLYPLYATVIAIESSSRDDDEQWLAYWDLIFISNSYRDAAPIHFRVDSYMVLFEIVGGRVSTGGGAAAGAGTSGGGGRGKSKFVHFISPNKEEHKVY